MGLLDRLSQLGVDLGTGVVTQAEGFAKALNADGEGDDNPTSQEGAKAGETSGADQDPVVEAPSADPQALHWDPFAIIEQLGYKEKPSAITYGTLQAMVWKVPLIQGIIMTRIAQISAFAKPQRNIFETGFRIKLRDDTAKPSAADKKFIRQCEEMMTTTGVSENPLGRDSFESFLKKAARDSLTYDQTCWEIVKNRKGQPAQFFAVDAKTIRLADSAKTFTDENDTSAIRCVQIYDNMVINEWTQEEMAFCIRNPSTDIRNYGYGVSEMEMLVAAITGYLWGFDYNARFFSQGSVAKGLLNIKGPINQKQLRAFRRQWHQMVSGVENAWRSPVMNADDVQWLNMQQSNRDMEFSSWMDFLIKIICAVFLLDPVEVNFKYGNTGSQKSMFEEANKQKLVESKDKGLKPILRFLARNLTNYIIRPINPDFEFEFVGLDSKSPTDLATLNQIRATKTHTVNELRAEYDLPPDPYGDIILDPTYIQYRQGQEMAEQGGDEDEDGGDGGSPFGGGDDDKDKGGDDDDGGFSPNDFKFSGGDDDKDKDDDKGGDDNKDKDETKKSMGHVPPPGTVILDLNF